MRRFAVLGLPLLVAATFFACEESTVDTGQPFYDFEAGGYDANRPSGDASAPGDAMPNDGPSDAEPAVERLALVAVGTGTMPITNAAIFTGGKWSAVSPIGPDEYGAVGGGVTFLPTGRALAVLRGNESGNAESTTWNGTNWGILAPFGATPASLVSPPASTKVGAWVADQAGQGAAAVRLYAYTDATSSWSAAEPVGITGDNHTIPAVAPTANGSPLVVMGVSPDKYQWSVRTGATWSAPATIAGITAPDGDFGLAAVVAVQRPGSSQIVAVFAHQPMTAQTSIVAAVYDGAAWSAPVTLGTDLMGAAVFAPFALAARSDGTVGVAYARSNGGIKVGAFDGTKWSPMADVPNVTAAQAYGPIAMAAGATTLDLAFIDTSFHLAHTRFADDAWSAPTYVDDKATYSKVSLARMP